MMQTIKIRKSTYFISIDRQNRWNAKRIMILPSSIKNKEESTSSQSQEMLWIESQVLLQITEKWSYTVIMTSYSHKGYIQVILLIKDTFLLQSLCCLLDDMVV